MYQLRDQRNPSCSDSGTESTCTADEYDSMASTGDNSRKRRMRGGVKQCEAAGQKKKKAAVPLQKPKKKSRGRVKIDIEFIEDTLKRRKTFSKRKFGVINKVKELAKLTGTQVLLLVASETGHVYEFASDKLQPMLTSEASKALIQSCLNSPMDSPPPPPPHHEEAPTDVSACPQDDDDAATDVSATGFEKTDLTFQVSESQSLRNINEDLKPPFNVAILPSTTTTTSGSAQPMVPTTSITSTVQESSGLQVQQHSQALTYYYFREGHMMYASPPHTVMYSPQGPCGLQVSHEELMEFCTEHLRC